MGETGVWAVCNDEARSAERMQNGTSSLELSTMTKSDRKRPRCAFLQTRNKKKHSRTHSVRHHAHVSASLCGIRRWGVQEVRKIVAFEARKERRHSRVLGEYAGHTQRYVLQFRVQRLAARTTVSRTPRYLGVLPPRASSGTRARAREREGGGERER